MIFISHSNEDKPLVEPVALRLAKVFGNNNVFYDRWSIQPGDGIVDKMNEGLTQCKFFFFFVSKKSLMSNMVKLEWQNAILKATKGEVRVIPVKLDDCMMPSILLQTLYIDLYGKGQETALRQMIDVVNGTNPFKEVAQEFQNIRGYISKIDNGCRIEFRAEAYMEPQSKFMILIDNLEEELVCSTEGIIMPTVFVRDWRISNTSSANAFILSRPNATSPGFPFVVKLIRKTSVPIRILDLLRAVSDTQARSIPVIEV